MKKKVAIFGAGISGLTVAHELAERNFDVSIYEKDSINGGMARSTRTMNKNVPSEHSWRAYGPFYYNLFDILGRLVIKTTQTKVQNDKQTAISSLTI
jgi:uncharacterized protein with NAD-binding domain and iron-sulfur cluster